MRTKKHAIVIYLFSLICLIDGQVGLSIFFGSIATFLMYKWWNHPKRLLLAELKKDSDRFKAKVPISYPLQLEFFKVYSKFLRLSTQHPTLKTTYREIIDSMWIKLSQKKSPKEWREIINNIDKTWPTPLDFEDLLKTSLDKVSSERTL